MGDNATLDARFPAGSRINRLSRRAKNQPVCRSTLQQTANGARHFDVPNANPGRVQMRRRATKQQIALTIGLLAALIAAGYWWAPHMWWAYLIARRGAHVPSIPVSTLKAPGKTSGWFTCHIGALSLKLPPEMAEDAERSVAKERNAISLKTPSAELKIFVPFQAPQGVRAPLVEAAARLNQTPMQLIADGYRASTDDFRWTMSRTELQRHQFLLNLGVMYPHVAGTKVESLFDGPLEGLLVIHDRTQAMFEWHSKSEKGAGYVAFSRTTGDLDLDVVREICASATCDDAQLRPELTKSELAELVDTMQIVRE
jgi:hypothetical protein